MSFNKAIDLISFPFRVGTAIGATLLAYKAPYLVGFLILVCFCIALVGLGFYVLILLSMKRRSRTACTNCGHQVLHAAKICPKCHTPTLLSSVSHIDHTLHPDMLQLLHHALKIDGDFGEREQKWLERVMQSINAPETDLQTLETTEDPSALIKSLQDKAKPNREVASEVLDLLAAAMATDGELSQNEYSLFVKVSKALGFSWWSRYRILARHRLAL